MTLPRSIRIAVTIPLLIAGSIGVWEGARLIRQREAVREIKELNGSVQFQSRRLEWLGKLIGDKRMELVGEPWHVVFWADEESLSRRSRFGGIVYPTHGPLISDGSLACVRRLPNLKSLDLAFSNIGDAGMEHVHRLRKLEELRLEGTDVSDESIPLLSQMKSLKELNVQHTKISTEGGLKLESAMPGCQVQGPHNDIWHY